MSEFSHLDRDGRARMVDISGKPVTSRTAVARGRLVTTPEVMALVRADGLPKADVLATARIAGIMGAKRTSDLIPLCHQIPLTNVSIDFELGEREILIEATASTRASTGVEMEALTAVAIAGLTLHDMVKAVDPRATLTGVALAFKSGGKRGEWTPADPDDASAVPESADGRPAERTAVVIVASTLGSRGEREDTTGPVIAAWLHERGFRIDRPRVVADAEIADAVAAAVREQPSVILTTGGTGVSPSDATPEATAAVLERELTGVSELLRRRGTDGTPLAALSRGRAGTVGRSVIVNLPGSPAGVRDGLEVLDSLLAHLVDQVSGVASGHDHRVDEHAVQEHTADEHHHDR